MMATVFGLNGGVLIPGSQCPKCAADLEYSGNYWCSSCSWVLQEGAVGNDRLAFELAYILLMKQTGRVDEIDMNVFSTSRKGCLS